MTPEKAAELGVPIVAKVAHAFYKNNKEGYQLHCLSPEDLISYLYDKVLFSKYTKAVEENPDYYTEESFQNSLFIACRKSMLDHVRHYLTSGKRGAITAPGAAVSLDSPDRDQSAHEVIASPQQTNYLYKVKQVVDNCPNILAKRAIYLVALEKYPSKHQLKRRLGMGQTEFAALWAEMMAAMTNFVRST